MPQNNNQPPQTTAEKLQGCQPGYFPHLPAGIRLAEAYVPWQIYSRTYPPGEALRKGTLFPELYRPYPY